MKKLFSKQIVRFLIGTLIFITSLEVTSLIGLWLSGNLPDASFKEEYRKHHQRKSGLKYGPSFDTGWSKIKPHPYFGYVLENSEYDGSYNINNHGFKSKEDFPIKKDRNDFIIAILGGSVAEGFCTTTGKYFVSTIKKKISTLKNKNIKLVCLTIGAYKQPQSFFVASYYAPMFDVAINIDGHNEVNPRSYHVTDNYRPRSSVRYDLPAFTEIFFDQGQDSFFKTGQKVYSTQIKKQIASTLDTFYFSSSPFIFLGWSLISKGLDHMTINIKPEKDLEDDVDIDESIMIKKRSKLWAKYTEMQYAALQSLNTKSIYFLQPNHHYKNSKPLIAKDEPYSKEYAKFISESYDALLLESLRLKKRGIPVYNLFDIFKSVKAKTYEDICHPNKLGNKIMAEEISKIIAEQRFI